MNYKSDGYIEDLIFRTAWKHYCYAECGGDTGGCHPRKWAKALTRLHVNEYIDWLNTNY